MVNFIHKTGEKVSISRGKAIDTARNGRAVPYKIYKSGDQAEPRPLIIWSHGLGGGRDGAGFLARFLAEYGYIVMHIQHFGTDTTMWEGKPGHPWDVIRATEITRQMTLDRFGDVPFIVSQLNAIEAEHDLNIDADRIGMSGHSFGAMTSQVMMGMTFPNDHDIMTSYAHDAFKAAIFYSFSSLSHVSDADSTELFRAMDRPMFYMTGTDDDSPISGLDYKHRLPAYNHASSQEKHVLIIQDGDHMVFTGSRGKLDENPNKDAQEELIQYSSLAFWETYLNDNAHAKDWLIASGFQGYLGGNGAYTYNREVIE